MAAAGLDHHVTVFAQDDIVAAIIVEHGGGTQLGGRTACLGDHVWLLQVHLAREGAAGKGMSTVTYKNPLHLCPGGPCRRPQAIRDRREEETCFHLCVLGPLRDSRTTQPSQRLLSRAWMELANGEHGSAVWLVLPKAQPCPRSPSSEPACQEDWCGTHGFSVAHGEVKASGRMSSQGGIWGPTAPQLASLHKWYLGLPFIGPHERTR